MKIDLEAPVELWRSQLPTEDYRACSLTLYNLTEQEVESCQVTLVLLDEKGEEQTRLQYRARDLHCEAGRTCRMDVPLEKDMPIPTEVDIIIEKVWDVQGIVWRRGKGGRVDYNSNALPAGRELDSLHHAAGPNAVGFPERQDAVWVCVCGRPNRLGDAICRRCHLDRELIFRQYSREAVLDAAQKQEQLMEDVSRAAREESSRRQAER